METTLSSQAGSDLRLRKVRKHSICDDVEQQLRDAILSGALPAGQPLAEARVAVELGVSRASVRQAKFQLSRDGLLEIDDRGTAFVRTMSQGDVNEIIEFRQALELSAARLACMRLTEENVAALEDNICRTEQEGNLSELTLLDIAFHEEIIRAARNSRLMAAWNTLRPQLQLWLASMHRQHSATTAQTWRKTVDGHRTLLKALMSGDPDQVDQVMREHTSWLKNFLSAKPDA